MQSGCLASQASFLPFSHIYASCILSSSSVTNTSESLFSNFLRLSLSLRLFTLPAVVAYSGSGVAVWFRVRLAGGRDGEASDIGLLPLRRTLSSLASPVLKVMKV